MRGIPGLLAKWMGWGLAAWVLGSGEARAREVEETASAVFVTAPGPRFPAPWRDTFRLEGPDVWMRQTVWARPWSVTELESVADFVVPYPLPEAVMYVAAPDAELLAEPTPASLRVGAVTPYAPVSVAHSKPWLPPGFVAVFSEGRVTGFLPREALTERPPPVERVLADGRAALERGELERVRQLAWAARALYPSDARTLALVRALDLNASEWKPPELASPEAELPAPGAHVTPAALLHVGAPSLPLLKQKDLWGLAPEEWLPINTVVLVLDVDGGWARVREVFPEERAALVGREGSVQWRSRPRESYGPEEEVGREGYVVARYLETSPVDPRALRAQARSPRPKVSREEAVALLARASAAEPWNRGVQLEAFQWALTPRPPTFSRAVLPVRAEATEVLVEGPFLAEEAFGSAADAPEAPGLEAVLYYGCGGDWLQAEVFEGQDAAVQEALANGTSALPADICLKDVDVAPPPPPPHYIVCNEESVDELSPEHRAARDREEAAARKQYEAEVLPEFERKLKRLRERFPQGPYLCVSVTNPAPLPRVNLRVQHYAMPAREEGACSSKRSHPSEDALQMGEVVVPYLAAEAKVELCIEVPRYEGMHYGAVLAPDVKAAEVFVRRLAWVQELMAESEEEMTYVEYSEALSTLLPHVGVSTAVVRECEETCY